MYASQEKLNTIKCKICDEDHNLRVCTQFRKLSIQERVDFVFKNQICNNCLSPSHTKKHCTSKNTCLNCGKPHHTLLHMRVFNPFRKTENDQSQNGQIDQNRKNFPKNSNNRPQDSEESNLPSTSEEARSRINSNYATNNTNILLRTALLQIESRGELFTIRALIDPGSERTFLSEKIADRLNLPFRRSYSEIVGIGTQSQIAEKECDIVLVSKINNFKLPVTAIVLPKLTNKIPSVSFDVTSSANLCGLDLADPNFNISSSIDLVLGNDSERSINLEGIRRDVCGSATAYQTVFGWVLSGSIQTNPIFSFSANVTPSEDTNRDKLIRKCGEQEELPSVNPISSEDEYCENVYKETTKRLPNGRYMVRLPLRQDFPEDRFLIPSTFTTLSQYNEVLSAYLTLDPMEETTSKELFSHKKCESFYIPHHAGIRPESKTTKVRTKSGGSLNDILYTSPIILHADLINVILNLRFCKVVFSGDMQKILVDPKYKPFQRILFQKFPREAVNDYQSVTFGLNSAPFLASRTLQQLSSDSQNKFPTSAKILRKETYVNDILTGAHSTENALESQDQLIRSLEPAGLLPRKITENNSQLSSFPKEYFYDSYLFKSYEANPMNALTDSFSCYVEPIPQAFKLIKRKFQEIQIPHWIESSPVNLVQFHGFCDPSKLAYGAAIYIQIHTLLPNAKWRQVNLWWPYNNLSWQGPYWLLKSKSEWPQSKPLNPFKSQEIIPKTEITNENTTVPTRSFHTSIVPEDILDRFSSYTRALRVLAHILRYISRFKPSFTHLSLSLLQLWENLKTIHYKLSLQWKEENLKSMHKRYKWKFSSPNLKIGDFVIVMDDLLPPCEWRLGRIENVHNGSDQNVRVVDVRTKTGTITRPITKLCYLPYNSS